MTVREQLNSIAESRIIILDGAMGSLIQVLNLDEKSYRGSLFADHPVPLEGCNDLLCLTRPGAIAVIHDTYLEAGADIIETCSFNSTSISLSGYGLGHTSYDISLASAKIARKSADKFTDYGKKRFVAGSIGPTSKGASLYPDVNDPSKRTVTWDELEAAYYDNARGLLDGGADILLVETIFDTLNAKAAIFAIKRLIEERQIDVPVMISAAVCGDGWLLSGQNLEAFLVSIMHINPWAIGLNCSFNAPKILPFIRLLSETAPCLVSAYPNAGIPNKFGRYEEMADLMATNIVPYFEDNLVNIIGGCCGSTPAHIAAIAEKAKKFEPRKVKKNSGFNYWGVFSGFEQFRIPHNSIHLGDTKDTAEMQAALEKGEYEEASDIARDIIENNHVVLKITVNNIEVINEKDLNAFLDYALMNSYVAKVPFYINSPYLSILQSGLKRLQGRCLAGPVNLTENEDEFIQKIRLIQQYGAAAVVQLISEVKESKILIAQKIYHLLVKNNYSVDNIVFDPIEPQDDSFCKWIQANCPGVILAL
jgi:5-methyltetrahydrofolate--homocysteine methyltransferase